jgi:hypothetical protein
VTQFGRRLACSTPLAMKNLVEVTYHPAFQHVIDGARQFRGQTRERLAFAVVFRASGEIRLASRVIPPEEDRGFREGPLERGLANFGAGGPVAFAGRFFGPFAHAAVGDNILDAGQTRAVMELLQQDEAQEFANAGHRVAQIDRLGIGPFGGVANVSLPVPEPLVRAADQCQVHCQAFRDRSVGKPLRDARAVGFVGQLFPDLRQGVLAVRLLDVAEQLRPLPGEVHAASEQVAGGAPLRGIDIGLWEHAAAEQYGDRVGVDPSVLGRAPMHRFHLQGMAPDDGNPLLGAQVGEPVPGDEAFDADDDILAIGRNRRETRLGCCPHIPVEDDRSILV